MQKNWQIILLLFGLTGICPAGENVCLFFPMEQDRIWHYLQRDGSGGLTAQINDTVTINDRLYYRFAPYGFNGGGPFYFLRPDNNVVWALNLGDSSEFVLFDFTAEPGRHWDVPVTISPPFIQCDWGGSITLSSTIDTLIFPDRTFYNCFRFEHSGHSCYDSGFLTTWFARDFGMIRIHQITVAGVIEWNLAMEKPDTLQIVGCYSIVGNPCLTIPCLPGAVSAVESEDTIFVLTHNDHMYTDGYFSWNDYTPADGDSIIIHGIVTQRTDIHKNPYQTLEIIEIAPYSAALLQTEARAMITIGTRLLQSYPNPFNPIATITYKTALVGTVDLSIYNILGQKIQTLVSGKKAAGTHTVKWNAERLPGGIYYGVLRSGDYYGVKRMVLLR